MKKALVVIDLEKGFITKHTKNLPAKIRQYIEAHGAEYDVIAFTQYKNHPKSNFVKNLDWHGFMTSKQWDIVDELKPFIHKNNLFPKDTYSSFIKGRLASSLKKSGIKEVHLVGIDTENCVITFARDAFDRGYRVVVLKDLSGSHSDPFLHKAALEIIADNIGEVR
jgi:nicotinamidase-related amidase